MSTGPSSLREHQTETARWISEIFNRLRFDSETHVGEGSIILTVQTQNEIIDLLTDLSETVPDEKEMLIEAHV